MVRREQSSTSDAPRTLRLRSTRESRRRLFHRERLPGSNKRTVLGLLALVIGTIASTSPEGLLLGVPLLVASGFLILWPLLVASRTR